jgi:hypothetical protein
MTSATGINFALVFACAIRIRETMRLGTPKLALAEEVFFQKNNASALICKHSHICTLAAPLSAVPTYICAFFLR